MRHRLRAQAALLAAPAPSCVSKMSRGAPAGTEPVLQAVQRSTSSPVSAGRALHVVTRACSSKARRCGRPVRRVRRTGTAGQGWRPERRVGKRLISGFSHGSFIKPWGMDQARGGHLIHTLIPAIWIEALRLRSILCLTAGGRCISKKPAVVTLLPCSNPYAFYTRSMAVPLA